MDKKIYIVGHRNPDLDSVVSACAYEHYKQNTTDSEYIGVVCGAVNPITKWVFSRFEKELPNKIDSISKKKVILVDHTDPEQRPDGWRNANILEVVDHREPNLENITPQKITIKNYGSVATIIAQKCVQDNVGIDSQLAGLLLSAILDDTLALKSPNTTATDEAIVAQMASKAKIGDINAFSKELLEKKDSWSSMSALEILNADKKEMVLNNSRIIISQIETMDSKAVEKRENEFFTILKNLENKQQTSLRLLMITDLMSNICTIFGVGEKIKDLEKIFGKNLIANRKMYLPNVLSRKTQVIPPILNYYSNQT
jgi:manganese-dependent inorganic pyrophosphatase